MLVPSGGRNVFVHARVSASWRQITRIGSNAVLKSQDTEYSETEMCMV